MTLHRLPSPHDAREIERDRLVLDYLRALDAGNDDAIDRILDAAAADPVLDQRLCDADRALLEAEGLSSAQAATEVDALAQRHLAPPDAPDTPLTVGRVAASLKANGRVPADAHDYNEALLHETPALPSTPRASLIERLLGEIASTPPASYVKAFKREAGRLLASVTPTSARLAARSTRRRDP